MFRAMFASLRSHGARLAMTALAVALGTGLMAGSFVFTATLTHSVDSLFAQAAAGTDVQVRRVGRPAQGGHERRGQRLAVPAEQDGPAADGAVGGGHVRQCPDRREHRCRNRLRRGAARALDRAGR